MRAALIALPEVPVRIVPGRLRADLARRQIHVEDLTRVHKGHRRSFVSVAAHASVTVSRCSRYFSSPARLRCGPSSKTSPNVRASLAQTLTIRIAVAERALLADARDGVHGGRSEGADVDARVAAEASLLGDDDGARLLVAQREGLSRAHLHTQRVGALSAEDGDGGHDSFLLGLDHVDPGACGVALAEVVQRAGDLARPAARALLDIDRHDTVHVEDSPSVGIKRDQGGQSWTGGAAHDVA